MPPMTATYAALPFGETAIPRGYAPIATRFTSRPFAVEMTLRSHVHQFETRTYLWSGVTATTFGTAPTSYAGRSRRRFMSMR